MKTIIFMVMLLGVAGSAFAQQSVTSDRIGSWLPQDPNGCYAVYGTARAQCLADRYSMQQDEKALHAEQPDLAGRALLDALALRVRDVFAATRR
jgi:hypothetical protein